MHFDTPGTRLPAVVPTNVNPMDIPLPEISNQPVNATSVSADAHATGRLISFFKVFIIIIVYQSLVSKYCKIQVFICLNVINAFGQKLSVLIF